MDSYQTLIEKVEKIEAEKKLDLSSGEDLSVGIMNLIGIEEHLFFTYNKTKDQKYLDLLDEVRKMRVELLREIIKDYEGEVWCISKHLLAASMRLMEVGTKELKKGHDLEHRRKANKMFENSYKLYSLFWGLNLSKTPKLQNSKTQNEVEFINDANDKTRKVSAFSKLNDFVQKALDCCRE